MGDRGLAKAEDCPNRIWIRGVPTTGSAEDQ